MARVRVAALTLVKMYRFRKYFGGTPARFAGGLEVEDEGKRGFKDTSRFLDGLYVFHQLLRLMEFANAVFLGLEMPWMNC